MKGTLFTHVNRVHANQKVPSYIVSLTFILCQTHVRWFSRSCDDCASRVIFVFMKNVANKRSHVLAKTMWIRTHWSHSIIRLFIGNWVLITMLLIACTESRKTLLSVANASWKSNNCARRHEILRRKWQIIPK